MSNGSDSAARYTATASTGSIPHFAANEQPFAGLTGSFLALGILCGITASAAEGS